jgi:hypothetical protein
LSGRFVFRRVGAGIDDRARDGARCADIDHGAFLRDAELPRGVSELQRFSFRTGFPT